MPSPPANVTFLFTDVASSTEGWERCAEAFDEAIQRQFRILTDAVRAHGGTPFKTVGDELCSWFPEAESAVRAAVEGQRNMLAENWPSGIPPVRVRMGIHTGEPVYRDGDFFGPPVNRVSRILDAAQPSQIIISGSTHSCLANIPGEYSIKSLGLHLLKGLPEPEALFQIEAPGLPASFAPPRTLDARAHNLPVNLTSFVGRQRELGDLNSHLSRAEVRLVTLTGPPGVGKTRLATQYASEYAFRYPDGVWLVELAAVTDPTLVAQQILDTLRYTSKPGQSAESALLESLKDRHLLLVLDNFEHLLPAASLVSSVIQSTGRVQILATSRIVLKRRGEVVVEVYPLPGPEDEDEPGIETLSQYPSTSLFVERARSARPGWEPVDSEADDIIRLCRELDGLPLAIELAAARMRAMTVSELRTRLSDRFRLLAARDSELPERQQTLRAALDWSYDLLASEERATLARLGVFRGGFDMDAAAYVCDSGDVWDTIPALQDHSFLISRERRGLMRYDLLEAVREYALERLGSADSPLRRKHADYYLPLAEAAAASRDTANEPRLFARIENDLENMREAMEWAAGAGESDILTRLTAAMSEFMRRRGWGTERLERIERALRIAESEFSDRPISAWLCYHRANALRDLGRLEEAETEADKTLRRATEFDDQRLQILTLNLLGVLVGKRNDLKAVKEYAEETRRLADRSADPYVIASALTNLANLHDEMGDTETAFREYEETLDLWGQVGSLRGQATAMCNMGVILNDRQGRSDEAIRLYVSAIDLQMQLDNRPAIALLLVNIAEACEGKHDHETALYLYSVAESMLEQARSALAGYASAGRERCAKSVDACKGQQIIREACEREPMEIARGIEQFLGERIRLQTR